MPDSTTAADKTTTQAGRTFSEAYRLSSTEAGEFLVELGRQLRDSDELTIDNGEWEQPLTFGEPVTLDIEFEEVDDPELGIEIELPGCADESTPDVNYLLSTFPASSISSIKTSAGAGRP
jgi:amphi-Trp domain-containing protein